MTLKLSESCVRVCCLAMMVPHANPVVETLQREVEIVLRLEFQHRKPPVSSNSEEIKHAAIASGRDRWNLRVDVLRFEMRKHARGGVGDRVIVRWLARFNAIAARV